MAANGAIKSIQSQTRDNISSCLVWMLLRSLRLDLTDLCSNKSTGRMFVLITTMSLASLDQCWDLKLGSQGIESIASLRVARLLEYSV